MVPLQRLEDLAAKVTHEASSHFTCEPQAQLQTEIANLADLIASGQLKSLPGCTTIWDYLGLVEAELEGVAEGTVRESRLDRAADAGSVK